MSEFSREFPSSGPRRPEPAQVDIPYLRRRLGCALWILLILLVFFSLGWARSFYTDYLWYGALGYQSVLFRVVSAEAWLLLLGLLVAALVAGPNIYLARRLDRSIPSFGSPILDPQLTAMVPKVLTVAVIVAAILGALFLAMGLSAQWDLVLRFLNGVPFGQKDPVFDRDLSFYIFTLPFLQFLRSWVLILIVGLAVLLAAFYYASRALRGEPFILTPGIRRHFAFLGAGAFVLIGFGHWLGRYQLLYSTRGSVHGIGYTEDNVLLPAQTALTFLALVVAGLIVGAALRNRFRVIAWAVVLWIGASILGQAVAPALVQRFRVEPNELAVERDYLAKHIRMTRQAYALDGVTSRSHPALGTFDARTVAENQGTIQNIRLWDEAPLLQSYNQIQFFRLYYDFLSVTTDRYVVDGQLRQVMLASRELSPEKLPAEAQRWVNRHLQFTHGYGAAMTPVTEVAPGGRPAFFLKDVPPKGQFELSRPEIYYGLKSLPFVVAPSAMDEFNYPGPDGPVYTRYQGRGGVSLGSLVRRLLYSWQFRDLNLLISGEIHRDSRIQYRRTVRERFSTLTPFLVPDENTYLVVADGRLFWIQDAYTVTNHYPYSTPWKGRQNYIRNSVKAVVDAYNGSIDYYVADPNDPLIRTYQAIFPGLFKPLDQMPAFLRPHLRYPLDFFAIQTHMLLQYHMEDPVVFYNKEDQWAFPVEKSFGETQVMSPYYIVARLPGEPKEEFLLLQPLTPNNRHNLVAWVTARSDTPHYGELSLFRFPSGRHVDGPNQVEARIDNDAVISEQFTLWGQVGSEVSRGILLVIPIGDAILYAEPVFLKPETLNFPELRRIILADAERVVMHPNIDAAMAAVVGDAPAVAPLADETGSTGPPAGPATRETPPPPAAVAPDELEQIRRDLREAMERLRQAQERLDRMKPK